MMLEILYLSFVFLSRFHGIKRTQVFAFVGFGVNLPRIDAVLA